MDDLKKLVAPKSNAANVPESIKKAFDEMKGMSKVNQILVGTSSGVATGYVISKVGKITGFVIGGGLIVLQIAQHFGYVQINWKKVKSDLRRQKERTFKAIEKSGVNDAATERFIDDAKSFIKENMTFVLSFTGGLLLGFTF